MNLSKLTFEQLYRLQHPTTLMRVTRTYHKRLRQLWDAEFCSAFTLVKKAESCFPEQAKPWKRLLAFLTGPELKNAVRDAADNARPLYIPGGNRLLLRVALDGARAWGRVRCILDLCQELEVPARVAYAGNLPEGPQYEIRVDTNDLGIAILLHRRGWYWEKLWNTCARYGVSAADLFDWVPKDLRAQNVQVNPINAPLNTAGQRADAYAMLTP